jgi:hypothetical protein
MEPFCALDFPLASTLAVPPDSTPTLCYSQDQFAELEGTPTFYIAKKNRHLFAAIRNSDGESISQA